MNFQDASNLRIPEGYVRTIHDKDSRLLWGSVGYNVSFDGNATQTTYSGKNLANFAGNTLASHNGLTITSSSDGTIKWTGTPTVSWANLTSNFAVSLPAGTYTFSTTPALNHRIYVHMTPSYDFVIEPNYTSVTHTFTSAIAAIRLDISGLSTSTNYNESVKLMLESGNQQTAYEPYVGGTASPNPEFPQPISVVTGENTVKVVGKNLINITPRKTGDGYYNNSGGVYVDNSYDDSLVTYETSENGLTATILSAWRGVFLASTPLQAGTQYHFKWDATSTGSVRASVYTLDSSFVITRRIGNYTNNPTSSDANITLRDGEMYIGLWVGSNNANDVVTISQPQIELGNSASAYEQYQEQSFTIDLGSTELAKVGAYTDEIAKVGTKWYIEKQIGKVVLDGSEAWSYSSSSPAPFRTSVVGGYASGSSADTYICDYYQSISWDKPWANYPYMVSMRYSGDTLAFRNIDISTLDAFKSWLSTHPTTVYYALATPSTTQITDATLIAQLEAVYDWVRRHGYNASVTGDLPIVINRTALPTA